MLPASHRFHRTRPPSTALKRPGYHSLLHTPGLETFVLTALCALSGQSESLSSWQRTHPAYLPLHVPERPVFLNSINSLQTFLFLLSISCLWVKLVYKTMTEYYIRAIKIIF
ncbi:hypothetical protein XENORESO_021814 [Xenotaenia resolanae]|uniref:Uncharacterized protein n=1 Tax=Xenotaenia resolanae TaxID=208358 RepID=A0ABV0W7K0_9TELE